jgi:hypothetical protein
MMGTSATVAYSSLSFSSRSWNSGRKLSRAFADTSFRDGMVPTPSRRFRNDQCSGRRVQSSGPRVRACFNASEVDGASRMRTSCSISRSAASCLPSDSSRSSKILICCLSLRLFRPRPVK